ncbi:MAG: quinolinate synthase NadA [Euryarchaeota archaeon]|nr:quinolinate synthase NadA [Euryarchaeota archaeon]
MNLAEEIKKLKKEMNAVILAHNYQRGEVQRIADFTGDSLQLARKATEIDADYIVFAGVDFMAETAAVLNPDKTVLIPSQVASCEMAIFLTPEMIEEARKKYPGAAVVLYVNSTAACKAMADITCTSANAVRVVESLNEDTVLFGPDSNLAQYVAKRTAKKIIPLPPNGHCYVHTNLMPENVRHDGVLLVHPECPMEMQNEADVIASTGGMIRYVAKSDAKRFVVATERDMVERLKMEFPEREFVPAWPDAICLGMKQITLRKVYESMKEKKYVVKVNDEIASKAKKAIERMLEVS